MDFFIESFAAALRLVASQDPELLAIIAVSLSVSGLATLGAALVGVPAGFLIAYGRFTGKRLVITLLNTLLALPTVVIVLFVYVFISRRGILGPLDLI